MVLPLLMDVDTGIDDALAVLLAVRSPELDLVGVGTVAGNVDPRLAASNTLRVLEVTGANDVPVAIGAAAPLLEPWAEVGWIHGEDGMGNTAQPTPNRAPAAEDAVHQLVRLSHEHAGRLVVVAIGPLTNLALALRLDPTVAARIGRLVIMGGSVRDGGNRGAWAEANIGVDPEAAAIVFDAPIPRTMVGLDVTMQTRINDADVAMFAASGDPAAELAAAILPHYLDVYEATSGVRACAMHDPLAVAVAARPALVGTRRLPLRVETAGRFTRGMTVADQRGPRAARDDPDAPTTDVALTVDTAAFLELLRTRLTSGPPGAVRGTEAPRLARPTPRRSAMARIAIIGDGPAGLSAALFLAKNDHDATVFGKDETAMHYAMLHNYLGIEDITGSEFQARARAQVEGLGATLVDAEVTELAVDGDGFRITTSEGTSERADYVVLAAARPGAKLATQLGIEAPKEGIPTDDEQLTSVDRVYAVGRIARQHRSQAIISAGAGAVAALDILSREAGEEFADWDSPPSED